MGSVHRPLCAWGGGHISTLYDLAVIKPFNAVWFIYLAVILLLAVGLFLLVGRRTAQCRRRVVLVLSVVTLVFLFAYRFELSRVPEYPFEFWNELPLHPCNLMAFIGIAAVITNRRTLQCFCFFGGTISILIALAAPLGFFSGVSIFSPLGVGYYGFHGLAMLLCISFPSLGLVKPKFRDILPVTLLFFLCACVAHAFNLLLRSTVFPHANYFFTFGIPGNPLLEPLRAAIPYDLLFQFPLALGGVLWCVAMVGLCRLGERLTGRFAKFDEP